MSWFIFLSCSSWFVDELRGQTTNPHPQHEVERRRGGTLFLEPHGPREAHPFCEGVKRSAASPAPRVLLLGNAPGAELDLLVIHGSKRLGFEFKHTVAPEVTKSMRIAMADLDLARLDVIHLGKDTYPLTDRVRAVAFERLQKDIGRLR